MTPPRAEASARADAGERVLDEGVLRLSVRLRPLAGRLTALEDSAGSGVPRRARP